MAGKGFDLNPAFFLEGEKPGFLLPMLRQTRQAFAAASRAPKLLGLGL
jgi:hypothetical protein